MKSAVSGLEKKIDALHNECKKSSGKQKSSGHKSSEFKNLVPKSETPAEPEYEFVRTRQTTHQEEFNASMEEAFDAASQELSKGSKEPIKLSFVNLLENAKESARVGANLGKEIGENIPVIGAVVGGALGAILGGVGGFLSGIRKKKQQGGVLHV